MTDEATTTETEETDANEETAATEEAAARTFSQADLDRIVRDRLARQKAQYGDYDQLKERAAKLAEIEESNKTDLEKAQARNAELEQKAEAATKSAQEASLRFAVVAEAAKKHITDPEDALALLNRDLLEIDENGTAQNVAAAIEALVEAKPYLVGNTRAQGSADLGARDGKAGAQQLSRDDLKNMSSAEIVKAQNEGRLDDLLRGDS